VAPALTNLLEADVKRRVRFKTLEQLRTLEGGGPELENLDIQLPSDQLYQQCQNPVGVFGTVSQLTTLSTTLRSSGLITAAMAYRSADRASIVAQYVAHALACWRFRHPECLCCRPRRVFHTPFGELQLAEGCG